MSQRDILTLLTLSDLKEPVTLKSGLHGYLRMGEKVSLASGLLTRKRKGRTEALQVGGDYRVDSVHLRATGRGWRQEVSLSALGVAPAWKNIKTPLPRKLAPRVSKVTLDPLLRFPSERPGNAGVRGGYEPHRSIPQVSLHLQDHEAIQHQT